MRICLILCFLTSLAHAGATTQPSVQAATQTTQVLGKALAEGDAATISQAVGQAPVRTLATHEESDLKQLAATFTGTRLVSARAYSGVPSTLAGDLAGDFSTGANVPQAVRQRMSPSDMPRANAIASQWLQRALRPQAGELIGILAFYEPPVLDSTDAGRVLFALVQFRHTDADVTIIGVVYGEPASAR